MMSEAAPDRPRRPTVHDVAREAGVSIATVSTTFSHPEKVRPQTQETVREVARALGYVPNGAARSLAQGRTRVLGFMLFSYLQPGLAPHPAVSGARTPREVPIEQGSDLERSRLYTGFVEDLRRGVELACQELGYGLLTGRAGPDGGSSGVSDLMSRIDGLVVLPWAEPEDRHALALRRMPIVALSTAEGEDAEDTMVLENELGMRALVRHLARDHGRSRFLFLGHFAGHDAQAREQGCTLEARERGLTVLPTLRTRTPQLTAEELDAHLASVGGPPDAVLCANDRFAEAAVRLLRERGLRVPEDVSVTGFDGSLTGAFLDPPLTSVRGDLERMGRTAVELLDARLKDPARAPEHVRIPVSLVLRESCGCRPGGPAAVDIE